MLRYNVIEKLNLGEFQLSQSYLFFYDKLEKANYYLENILDTTEHDLNSRLISYLNEAPVNDGGQWDMAVNLLGSSPCAVVYRKLNDREIRCTPTDAISRVVLVLGIGSTRFNSHYQTPRIRSSTPGQPRQCSKTQGSILG